MTEVVDDREDFYRDRPVNYQEMEDFYRDLWQVSPWVFQVRAGKSAKGNPVFRQLYGDELRVELEKAARKVGRVLPEPVFAEEPF